MRGVLARPGSGLAQPSFECRLCVTRGVALLQRLGGLSRHAARIWIWDDLHSDLRPVGLECPSWWNAACVCFHGSHAVTDRQTFYWSGGFPNAGALQKQTDGTTTHLQPFPLSCERPL